MQTIDANGSAPPAAPAAASELRRCRIRFTGTGQEYFRIWIVNLLLTIATLGIYSAWAKVRKLQYFYRNTDLDGSVFDYHGDPLAILKGRMLAVLMLVLYKLALTFLGPFALVAVLALIAVIPWLLTQSYRFRLHNSSYRGLRFWFAGPVSQAYLIFGLPMALALAPGALAAMGMGGSPQHPAPRLALGIGLFYLALMLLWPYLHFCFKRWQHGHASYGTARASFEGSAWDFYAPYLTAAAMMLAATIVVGVVAGGLGLAALGRGAGRGIGAGFLVPIVLFYVAALAIMPLVTAWTQNAAWSATRLEEVAFESDARAARLIGITLSNLLMVVLSLGLLIPFALMRSMKYRIESIQVLDADALARFVSDGKDAQVGATGEGAVDVMDLDFGL